MSDGGNIRRCLAVLTLLTGISSARTIYVDHGAGGRNDGSTWADAHVCLQGALRCAGDDDEIRIAGGVYRPAEAREGRGSREATFYLKKNLAIRGGYAGSGEADPDVRDVDVYETVLSGDLRGDDTADFGNREDNCYHVVTVDLGNIEVVLEDLTITGGNADGSYARACGGGIFSQSHQYMRRIALAGCTLSNNLARDSGGGMYNGTGELDLRGCSFADNRAGTGAGLFNCEASKVIIDACVFSGNHAGIDGGAIFNGNRSEVRADGCTFSGNSAAGAGGAIVDPCRKASLTNCIFVANSSMTGAGIKPGGTTGCTFADNVSLASDYPELTSPALDTAIARADNDYANKAPFEDAGSRLVELPLSVRARIQAITTRSYCGTVYEGPVSYASRFGPVFQIRIPDNPNLHLYVYRLYGFMNLSSSILMLHDTRTGEITAQSVGVDGQWLYRYESRAFVGFDDLDQDGSPEIVVQDNCHCGTSCGSTVYRYFHIAEDLSFVLVAVRETQVPCPGCLSPRKCALVLREFEKLEPNRVLLVVKLADQEDEGQNEEIGAVVFECEGPGKPFLIRERVAADDTYGRYVEKLMTFASWDWCKPFR
jgi:hypothetical protein